MHKISHETSQESLTLSIQAHEAGIRLDRYLTSILTGISRTTVQQLIMDGEVLVNGHTGKSGYTLRIGDEVQIMSLNMHNKAANIKPQSLPLDVLYEDKDLLVVNKAAGMVVHPAPGHHDDTLVNALLARYPDIQREDSEQRPGIIHRLDKDTSGLIIIARNAATHSALVEQMKRREIVKRYLALVEGVVALDQGSIDAPIYGSGSINRSLSLKRQFLHAYQLKFIHPTTGSILNLEAPLPEDLQAVLNQKSFL